MAVSGSATLADRFDPRNNSLSVLRLFLAGTVAMVHSQALGWGDQPRLGQAQIGDLAVDGFFVISGFLVTRSARRLPSLARFAWHRALRILPGFWACLLVTAFVVAPVMAHMQELPQARLFETPDSAVGYVVRNAGLQIRQWDIAGLTANSGDGAAMDGSLWTLYYEALCYLVVGVLVALGVIRTGKALGSRRTPAGRVSELLGRYRMGWLIPGAVRRHPVIVITLLGWLTLLARQTGVLTVGPQLMGRFLVLFLLGALGHLYADRIRFPLALVLPALLVLGVSLVLLWDYRTLGSVAFAYLLLWAVVALPLRFEPSADVSYGLYVYHWPIAQTLVAAGATAVGRAPFALLTLAVTTVFALVSWHLVESPAMARKNLPLPRLLPVGDLRLVRHGRY